jgi:hypothetical protein
MSKSKSNSKSKDPITLLEIISNNDNTFEIKMRQVDQKSVPVLVGLLEKVKFELLYSDIDDVEEELDDLPINFSSNKYDA